MTSTKGWKVSERVEERQKANGPQTYLMLAIEMQDGKHYLSRVNPSFARRIESKLALVRELRSHRWYTTQESYFEDYPQVRSSGQTNLEIRFRKASECVDSIRNVSPAMYD